MRLLDLFCGAGGAAMGYHRAGFKIVGVDHDPQPNYPFPSVRADALEYLERFGQDFDAIHASPPCQAYCYLAAIHRKMADHPKLIEPTRELLEKSGRPWVIENVMNAPLSGATMLCGSAFGLRVRRHRLFEASVLLFGTRCEHKRQGRSVGVYGHQGSGLLRPRRNGGPFIRAKGTADAGDAMGIDWMTWRELTQAIPPAYTEFIGRQLIRLRERAA